MTGLLLLVFSAFAVLGTAHASSSTHATHQDQAVASAQQDAYSHSDDRSEVADEPCCHPEAAPDRDCGQVCTFLALLPDPLPFATADGAYVYVANQGSEAEPNDTVSVIETATGQVLKTITTGDGAHGVSASADGAFVFVTNIADDTVSIIDVASQDVVKTVPVGDRPNGIVYGGSNQ